MTHVYQEECEAEGVDPKRIAQIARGISRYARELESMGLGVFGGGTGGSIRGKADSRGRLVLATLDGEFDGGDGAYGADDDGLMRGES